MPWKYLTLTNMLEIIRICWKDRTSPKQPNWCQLKQYNFFPDWSEMTRRCDLTWPVVILSCCHVDLLSRHDLFWSIMLCHVVSCCVMSCAMSCYVSCCVMCHVLTSVMSCHVSCLVMHRVMLCCVICHVNSCVIYHVACVMNLSCVLSCYISYVMLCHVSYPVWHDVMSWYGLMQASS